MTTRSFTSAPLLLAAAACLLALPAQAQAQVPAPAMKKVQGWQKVTPTRFVIGADRKRHSATCSGFPGTDKTFSFWAKRGTSRNLMVYFEGGGACWDSLTCSFPFAPGLPPAVPQFFVPAVDPAADPAGFDGIFKSDPANPTKDWSVVYIPYCTGDLHTGSSSKSYVNVGNPDPAVPASFQIEHRGFDNFMVVLDWMKKNLDRRPEQLLVTGSSAGGYGAIANYPWLQRSYPRAQSFMIADASQGVTTPGFDTGTPGRGSWNMQLAPWVFGDNPQAIPGPEILRVAARALPAVQTAQFTTALDTVQVGFYGLMKLAYGPGGSCPDPAIDWYQQMSGTLQSYAAELPNFRHYVAAGDYHTIMTSPLFYSESSAGPAFSRWTAGMLAGSADWSNAACPTCLIPVSCP
jgi:Pectinacetylesterase